MSNSKNKLPYINEDGQKVYRICPVCGGEVMERYAVFCKSQCRRKADKESKYQRRYTIGRV